MDKLHTLYTVLDLVGTFVFAISGATAAKQRGLDLFGIATIAFTVACGGGIIRDLCIGAIPPTGLSVWYYLATALLAAAITTGLYSFVLRINRPVILFDAMGLALFGVTGAEKALSYGHNAEVAILLGTTTAVGGGVLRDVLLNRVPIILQKEIYASAALLGASVVVVGNHLAWIPTDWVSIVGLSLSFTVRMLALRYHWNLPGSPPDKTSSD
ncbi:trimeric intracellular cation channel family protein [Spirosoma fluminis]